MTTSITNRGLSGNHCCDEINACCARLTPSPEEVLHAAYFGYKPPRLDIENMVLFNVGSFMSAGCNGIRYEHGAGVPTAPDGELYRVGYRYALASRTASFTDWQESRTLASFGWTGLEAFHRGKIAAQVWLALARRRYSEPEPSPELASGTSFAVKTKIRPPFGQSPRISADLVKGIVDGVVSAFQAHTDRSTSGEVAVRLANVLPADPAEIEDLLLDRRWAVLGPVTRLVHLRGGGVQWNPSDDWCDAGELLAAEPRPTNTTWAIRGQIVELDR